MLRPLLLLLLCCPHLLVAQVNPAEINPLRPSGQTDLLVPDTLSEAEAYEEAQKNTLLLQNPGALLPLQRLDTLRLASIAIGMEQDAAFRQMLQRYTTVDPILLKADIEDKNQLIDRLESYDLILIGIGTDRITSDQRELVFQLLENRPTVLAHFGTFEDLQQLPTLHHASAFLYNSWGEEMSHSVVAQIIFGGAQPGRSILDGQLSTPHNWVTRLGYAPAQTVGFDEATLQGGIDSVVLEGLAAEAFPGAQVLVAKGGKVVFYKAYGYHTYDQKRKVSLEDLYDYASVTKVSSALPVIMKLYGEGRFDLDATLGDYFPIMKGSNKADLDFRNILAHNARLKPYIVYWQNTLKKNGKYKWRTFKNKQNRRFNIRITDQLYLHRKYKKKMYKAIRKSGLEAEPGYKYSGLSFLLYPEMLSQMTGKEYEQYLQNTFYRPLGAHTITFNPDRHFPLDRIVPTERDTFFRMTQVHGIVHDEAAAMLAGVSANAGLFSTANDLAKLFQMYLNGGSYGGERYISKEALTAFTRCAFCEEGNHRGLGFDKPLPDADTEELSISSVASSSSFGHSGYTGTFVWADPEQDLLFIFFSNRVYPTRDNRKLYSMNIRPRIMKAIYDAIEKEPE